MFKKLISILFVIPMLWANSCKNDKKENMDSMNANPESIEFKTINYNKKFGDCSNPDSLCYELDIQNLQIYSGPRVVQNTVNKAVDKYLFTTLGSFLSEDSPALASLDEYAEALIQDYKHVASEFDDYEQDWNIQVKTELKNNDDNIISILTTVDSYLGGAHGNHWNDFLNFDANTGGEIGWKDIIRDQDKFMKLAETGFRKERILSPDADFEREGYFFKDGIFVLPENIGFNSKGVVLIYNPYEVAPYSMGSTEFIIPWTAIENITSLK